MNIIDINFKYLSKLKLNDVWIFDEREVGITLNELVNLTIDYDGTTFYVTAITSSDFTNLNDGEFPAEVNPKYLTKTQLRHFKSVLYKIITYVYNSEKLYQSVMDKDYYSDLTTNQIDLVETMQSNVEFKSLIDRIKLYLFFD